MKFSDDFVQQFLYLLFHFNMRPTTPVPYGCSMTLFSCQINLDPPHHFQQPSSSLPQKKYSIFHKKNQGLGRQKHSLRNRNHKNTLRESAGISQISNLSQQNDQKYDDRFSEVSSVIEPQLRNREKKESERTKVYCQTLASQDRNICQKVQHQFSQIYEQNKENSKDRCIFADEITLNLKAGSQLKERETAHTNNISQRRVFTEENRKQNKVFFPTQKSDKATTQIYKSQLISPDQYQGFFFPSMASSTFPKNSDVIRSDMMSVNSGFPQHKPALKKSSILGSTTSKNYQSPASAEKQIKFQPLQTHPGMPGSEITHVRKPSSPKKFSTLVDLQCKNIDSSGGEHTSSNHVSIVTSQPSFNNISVRDSGAGDFAKVIKLMTLKSLPLSQDIWLNMKKNTN